MGKHPEDLMFVNCLILMDLSQLRGGCGTFLAKDIVSERTYLFPNKCNQRINSFVDCVNHKWFYLLTVIQYHLSNEAAYCFSVHPKVSNARCRADQRRGYGSGPDQKTAARGATRNTPDRRAKTPRAHPQDYHSALHGVYEYHRLKCSLS